MTVLAKEVELKKNIKNQAGEEKEKVHHKANREAETKVRNVSIEVETKRKKMHQIPVLTQVQVHRVEVLVQVQRVKREGVGLRSVNRKTRRNMQRERARVNQKLKRNHLLRVSEEGE